MRRSRWAWVATLGAGLAGLVLAVPVLYEVSVSLMTPVEARALPPVPFPGDPQFANYAAGWNGIGVAGLLVTTALLAVLVAALQILTVLRPRSRWPDFAFPVARRWCGWWSSSRPSRRSCCWCRGT